MNNFSNLLARALTVMNERIKEMNTATRVGSLFRDILLFFNTLITDIAASIDILAVTKADKSVVDALMNGVIKQPAVDTYNTGVNSLAAIYGLTASNNGSNGKAKQNGWDVLVRNDETKGGISNRYNWNGSIWVDMETGGYDDLLEKTVNDNFNATLFNLNNLNNEVYALSNKDGVIRYIDFSRETKPSDSSVNTGLKGYYYVDRFQKLLRGIKIDTFVVQIKTGGTFSVIKGHNVGTSYFTHEVLKKFDVVAGKNILSLDVPIVLTDLESIGFLQSTDTAVFNYNNYSSGTSIFNKNYTHLNANNKWSVGVGSLSIDVGIKYAKGIISSIQEQVVETNNVFGLLKFIPVDTFSTSQEAPSGYFFKDEIMSKIRGREISSIGINIARTGTITISKCTNLGNNDYTPEQIETFTAYNTGFNKFQLSEILTLKDDEYLGIQVESDTAKFLYKTNADSRYDIGYMYKRADGVWSGNTTSSLNIQLYDLNNFQHIKDDVQVVYDSIFIQETEESVLVSRVENTTEATSITPYDHYYYGDNVMKLFRGSKVTSVKLDIQEIGTLTVVKGRNIMKSDYSKEIIQVFEITELGEQTLVFDNTQVFSANEYIGFASPTDTAKFYYKRDPSAGYHLTFYSKNSTGWSTSVGSLNISIDGYKLVNRIDEIETAISTIPSLKGKVLSILSHSIGTYKGYIPEGYAYWYPNGDVNSPLKTWWGKLLTRTGMVLGINNSYSGSKVAGTDNAAMCSEARLTNLGNPDVIIFDGCTNDFSSGVAKGVISQNDTTLDITTFAGAYQQVLKRLTLLYPNAKIFVCTPLQRARYSESPTFPVKRSDGTFLYEFANIIRELANMYGVHIIDWASTGITYQNSNNNPTAIGATGSVFLIDGLHPKEVGMDLMEIDAENYLKRVFK